MLGRLVISSPAHLRNAASDQIAHFFLNQHNRLEPRLTTHHSLPTSLAHMYPQLHSPSERHHHIHTSLHFPARDRRGDQRCRDEDVRRDFDSQTNRFNWLVCGIFRGT
jgi:hypothetical protein